MYEHILVPVDGSETSLLGVDEAVRLSKISGGTIRLFHAIDDQSFSLAMSSIAYEDNWREELRKVGRAILQTARARCAAGGCEAQTTMCESFALPVHRRVLEAAAAWPADLIVVGTHGRRGVKRAFLGSGAESILREATVPVLLVRDANRERSGADQATRRIDATTEAAVG